jgi:hypothetical protein
MQKRIHERLKEEAAAAPAGMSRPTFEYPTHAGEDGTHLVREGERLSAVERRRRRSRRGIPRGPDHRSCVDGWPREEVLGLRALVLRGPTGARQPADVRSGGVYPIGEPHPSRVSEAWS